MCVVSAWNIYTGGTATFARIDDIKLSTSWHEVGGLIVQVMSDEEASLIDRLTCKRCSGWDVKTGTGERSHQI